MISNTLIDKTIHIKRIRVNDLYKFYQDYSANKGPDELEVITKQRALSQSKNPYADENDIGLLIALRGNDYIGYLGLLPGIASYNGKLEKVYWPSTWYVSESVRGDSVGFLLYKEAFQLNRVLIATGMSKEAEKIYPLLGFRRMNPLKFCQIDFMKLDFRIVRIIDKVIQKYFILIKNNKLSKSRAKVLYKIIKKYYYRLVENKYRSYFENIHYEEVENFENIESSEIIDGRCRFFRDQKIINWMVNYPWVKSREKESQEDKIKYFFSNIRDEFKYVALQIYSGEEKNKIGFMVFSISTQFGKTNIRLLDHEITYGNSKVLLTILLTYAKNVLADKIEVTDEFSVLLKNGILGYFSTSKERTYCYYTPDRNAEWIKSVITDYCDGDTAFT